MNDVRPPNIALITRRVSAGRPTIVARVRDAASGVDPLSLAPAVRASQVGATRRSTRRPASRLLRSHGTRSRSSRGPEFMRVFASDYQETKNIHTEGVNPMPNSRFRGIRMEVVNRPAITWIAPNRNACLPRRAKPAGGRGLDASRSRRSASSTASGRSRACAGTTRGSTGTRGTRHARGGGRTR